MKQEIRKKYKNLRNTLTTVETTEYSEKILEKLTLLPFWQNAQRIMCYLSFGNEVVTKPIIEKAWHEKKEVIIPVCQKNTTTILPSLLNTFDDLEPKTMGILEPKEGKLVEVDPQSIDLCLIPGLAFDLQGNRLGFGAGYYDRFLPSLENSTPKVALAYQIQINPTLLPADEYDVKMDYIITEETVYKC